MISLNLILWKIRNLADFSEICNEIHSEIRNGIYNEILMKYAVK